jgi:hypothetical protein
MADSQHPDPARRPLSQRLQPFAEFLYKAILATSAMLAIWKALH